MSLRNLELVQPRRRTLLLALVAFCVAAFVAALVASSTGGPAQRNRGQLAQAIQNAKSNSGATSSRIATDTAHQAVVNETSVTWYDQTGHQYVTPTTDAGQTLQLFDDTGFHNYQQNVGPSGVALLIELIGPLTTIVIIYFLFRFLKKGGMPGMSLGKSRAREIAPEVTGVTFADVAGADSALLELREIVEILKNSKKFTTLGARTPKGVILNGPPGTGKTLLARAVAGEASVPFFSVSGSEFVELYVGVGAARVRDLFAQAREKGPAIIFIDEIDAVGRRRGAGNGHSNDEREQTLNQLLVELDGVETTEAVIVIAATNRPDILDPALLRPGRFDRHVTIDNPDLAGREAILRIHARAKPLAEGVDWAVVARQTPGFSGADLANLVNESAMLAAREDAAHITMAHIEDACMRVIAGPRRSTSIMNEHERRIVAHHEMGHALVGLVLPNADPVHKVSIVSRGRALGLTMQLPERDKALGNRHEFTDRIAGLLGGRVAEEIVFGHDAITSGAADDIEKATMLAQRMVTEMGMSPLGPRHFPAVEPGEPRAYSERTAEAIDSEVDLLLAEASVRAHDVLDRRRDVLEALATRLLEVETMEADELKEIVAGFGKRKEPPKSKIGPQPPRSTDSHTPSDTNKYEYLMPPGSNKPGPQNKRTVRRTLAAFSRLFSRVPAD
jgi:cell division protease FtsH